MSNKNGVPSRSPAGWSSLHFEAPRVAAVVASLILRTRGVVATLIRLIANEVNLRYRTRSDIVDGSGIFADGQIEDFRRELERRLIEAPWNKDKPDGETALHLPKIHLQC